MNSGNPLDRPAPLLVVSDVDGTLLNSHDRVTPLSQKLNKTWCNHFLNLKNLYLFSSLSIVSTHEIYVF